MLPPLLLALAAFALALIAASQRATTRARERLAALRGGHAARPDPERLPEALRAHLARAGLPEGAASRWVRVEQRGQMRLRPEDRWRPFRAEQVWAVDRLAFAWWARTSMAGVPLRVLDALDEGQGLLDVRVLGFVVARARGPATTRGQAQRYLAELPWCPPALAANPAIAWEERGDGLLVARATVGGEPTQVTWELDEQGDPRRVRAVRPRTTPEGPVDTPWAGEFADYRPIGGLRVPVHGEVRWELPDGPFTYWRGEVTALDWG